MYNFTIIKLQECGTQFRPLYPAIKLGVHANPPVEMNPPRLNLPPQLRL